MSCETVKMPPKLKPSPCSNVHYTCLWVSTIYRLRILKSIPQSAGTALRGMHNIVLSACSIIDTVWPEILVGNLLRRIGGFESNRPIFHPPKNFKV